MGVGRVRIVVVPPPPPPPPVVPVLPPDGVTLEVFEGMLRVKPGGITPVQVSEILRHKVYITDETTVSFTGTAITPLKEFIHIGIPALGFSPVAMVHIIEAKVNRPTAFLRITVNGVVVGMVSFTETVWTRKTITHTVPATGALVRLEGYSESPEVTCDQRVWEICYRL